MPNTATNADSDSDIGPLLAENLKQRRSVRFRAEGNSMEPFIRAGDMVTVAPLPSDGLIPSVRAGDVLLFEKRPGQLRLHRYAPKPFGRRESRTKCVRVRGDAFGQPSEWIPAECVLGALVCYERGGRTFDARAPLRRLAGLWWPRIRSRLPFRRRPAARQDDDGCSNVSAPMDLLIEAVRATLRPSAAPLRPAPPRPSPPQQERHGRAVVELAQRHGVLAFCASELIRRLPAERTEIQEAARALTMESESDQAAVAEVLRTLREHGIPPLVVKGPALGCWFYDNPALRPFDDLDLLLAGSERGYVLRLLEATGWRDSRGSPPQVQQHLLHTTEDLALRHPRHHVGVDLVHSGGILRQAGLHPPASVPRMGFHVQGVRADAPSPVEHFLFCAAHGCKHGWTRLVWLVDLDRLSSTFTSEDWKRAVSLARTREITRLLALGCALAGDLLGMPYPGDALGRWKDSPWLARAMAGCAQARRTGRRHVETWRWWAFLQDNRSRRWRVLRDWLFHPTGADLRFCLLPLRARGLYAVLRPLRLLMRLALRRGTPDLEWSASNQGSGRQGSGPNTR